MDKAPREVIARALYLWDRTVGEDRTAAAYLAAAGAVISLRAAGLDDTWKLMDVIARWDTVTGEFRGRTVYLQLADLVMRMPASGT